MAFEKFVETSRSYRPKVSIRKNGAIGFSSGAVARFKLSAEIFPFVVLFYDSSAKTIGLLPVAEEEPGAHKINFGRTGAVINARRFFDFFSIGLDAKPFKLDAHWSEEDQMITIPLER